MKAIDPVRIEGLAATKAYAHFYRDPHGCMQRLHRDHGEAVCLGPALPLLPERPQWLLLMGERFNREILNETSRLRPSGAWPIRGPKGSAQNNLRKNLLRLHGPWHSHISALVRPILNRKAVSGFGSRVRDIVCDELAKWPVGETADVLVLLRHMTQRLGLELLFDEADPDRVRTISELIDNYHSHNWSLRTQLNRIATPWSPYRKMLREAEEIQRLMVQWAAERKGCPINSDLRSVLANARGVDGLPMAPERLAAQLAALALGSYETQASVMTWALFLLAQHPTVMAELVEGLNHARREGAQTPDAVPLVNHVLRETLRIISPVPFLALQVRAPLDVFGFPMRVKSMVVLSPFITHRDPTIYAEPSRFLPERWKSINPSTYQYLAFSGGPRRCPGFWYAMNNMGVMLSEIVSRFRLTVQPGARINRQFAATTIPRRGMPMRIVPQDLSFTASAIRGNILNMIDFTPPHEHRNTILQAA